MREFFNLPENLIYLNSANLSLCPRAVNDAVTRYRDEFEKNPTEGLNQAWGKLWRIQERLAEFLGAEVRNLFLRPNVTDVLNTFLLGIPLAEDSEILVSEFEYGSIVNIVKFRAKRENLHWRMLSLPATPAAFRELSAQKLVDLVISQLGPKTKILLLSHVIAGTGLVMPLPEIARVTRERGIFLVVDGAYAPGAISVDFNQLDDVDFYGCSLYKWMLGPKGTAFGHVAARHHASLIPTAVGWTTFDSFGPFAAFGGGSQFQSAFLMPGCRDFSPFFALGDTLDFWQGVGVIEARDRIAKLGHYFNKVSDEKLGWHRLRGAERSLQGPMLLSKLPDALQAQGPTLANRLLFEFGIQVQMVPLRESWYLSCSPHVYNTEEEIDRAVGVFNQL